MRPWSVDMRHAFETMIDIMAGELRPACRAPGHLITPPYRTINDLQVNSLWAARVSRLVEQASGWKQRRSAFGRGLACLFALRPRQARTDRRTPRHGKLRLDFDGSITLRGGRPARVPLAQVAAEALASVAALCVISADSALTPKDNGSYSSRVSFRRRARGRQATQGASDQCRRKAAGSQRRDIECRGETYVVAGSDRGISREAVRGAAQDGPITAHLYRPEDLQGESSGAGAGPAGIFRRQVVEVAVDADTNRIERLGGA